jgi:RNA polymerase sigma-70 factor (ECF subfamily)
MPAGRRRHTASLRTMDSAPPADAEAPLRAAGRAEANRDWSRLMGRAQDGDREAYRTLLQQVTPYLRTLSARCFREPSDVEDTVQDVLLTIHAIRHTYDPQRPFGPWLVAIANRRIIDRIRRYSRNQRREVEFTVEHETFLTDPTNLHMDTAETAETDATLREAIDQLPPDQRQAIHMLKLNEMSLKEAAAASGRSVAALKVATHRAIKSLRKLLRPPSETP